MADNDNTLPPIRADISMALRPEMLNPHAAVLKAEGSRCGPALDGAQRALGAMHTELALMADARASAFESISPIAKREIALLNQGQSKGKMKAPPGTYVGPDGKLAIHLAPEVAREFNTAAELAFKRGAVKLDSARKVAIETREALDFEVKAKMKDPAAATPVGIASGQEIRAHVRALGPSERVTFVQQQIVAGNRRVANAILGSEPFLWGGTAQQQSVLSEMAEKSFAPKEYAQRAALTSVVQAIEDAGRISVEHFAKALVVVPNADKQANLALSKLRTGGQ
jgi:hypothetical protein